MHGRMQFADFVVSWALQSLGRALQRLSASGSQELPANDEKAIAQTADMLLSLWQMVRWSVGRVEYRQARADLMEIMGNLMDNSYKYSEHRVHLCGTMESERDSGRQVLRLLFEDDGQGIPEGVREDVLSRGVRFDQQQPGQGIGLSVAKEIVDLYGGRLRVGEGRLGGASIEVTLPQG